MTDAELRGKMLTVFYDCRHNAQGWVPTSDMEFAGGGAVDRQMVGTVGRQLADANLIRWKPLTGAQEGFVIGMAQITAFGVDVIEGSTRSAINIVLPVPMARQPPATPSPPPAVTEFHDTKLQPEIFSLKPGIWGISIDLKALFGRLWRTFRKLG